MFRDKLNNFKDNTEAIWKRINKILFPSSSNEKEIIKNIVYNDSRYEINVYIANGLNEFFFNVGSTFVKL